MIGAEERFFSIDVPQLNQLQKRFLQGERTNLLCDRDFLMEMLEGISPNVLARGAIGASAF
jgi:hypothetical protein